MSLFRIALIIVIVLPVQSFAQTTPGGGVIFPGSIDAKPAPLILNAHVGDGGVLTPVDLAKRYPQLSKLESEVNIIVARQFALCYPQLKFSNLAEFATAYNLIIIEMMGSFLSAHHAPEFQCPDTAATTKAPQSNIEHCLTIKNSSEAAKVKLFVSDSLVRNYLGEKYPKAGKGVEEIIFFLRTLGG